MPIIRLFPTNLIVDNIDRKLTEDEIKSVNKIGESLMRNAHNFHSANVRVLDDHFPDIRKFIEKNLQKYVDLIIRPKNKIELYITQSWINFNKPNDFHHLHAHPNSFLSGVFYLNANKKTDKIMFMKSVHNQFLIESTKYDWDNSNDHTFSVGTGDLIIFPSHLCHLVPEHVEDDVRLSLAFNTFIRGDFGGEKYLQRLVLE